MPVVEIHEETLLGYFGRVTLDFRKSISFRHLTPGRIISSFKGSVGIFLRDLWDGDFCETSAKLQP